MAKHVLNMLQQYTSEEEAEQGIDCDAINKALQDGKITVVRSEHGVAVVPKAEYYAKVCRRGAGRTYENLFSDEAIKEADKIDIVTSNRGCYVKSDETDQEQWDRLDGHQKCMKAAADVAYEEQNKGRILKSGSLSIRKNEDGSYEYVSETQSDVDAGTVSDALERLERLEKGFWTIATIILQQHTLAPFHDVQNNITKLREIMNQHL